VNGEPVEVTVEPRELLVDTLRNRLRLTGAHVACGHGGCGACAVLVDGSGARACLVFTVQVAGTDVVTVEGISAEGLHPVQVALSRCHGLQCGFCTSGVVVTCVELLAERRELTEDDVRRRLAGQLCRCTGYAGMVDAVLATAKELASDPTGERVTEPADR
jgi:carbon-monoxide dehydrogenase small subunit